jgi:CRP-like cAMP-binding protein
MNVTETFSGCTISDDHCHCFNLLTEEECALIEKNSVYVNFKKGEMVCKQGSLSSHIMVVTEGLIKVFLESNKNILVLKIISSNNILGLSAFRGENNVFSYSASAYVDTRIKQIDNITFWNIVKNNKEFAQEIFNIMGNNREQIQSRFFCMVHKQSYGKIADILLCLGNKVFQSTSFDLPLSRKDIAELTGIRAETATRILSKFQEDNLIKIKGSKIQILDVEKLNMLSELG